MTKWITREHPKIDRIACPWLIRRFIEPDAEFIYVPTEQVFADAKDIGATPYDIPGAEPFSHDGELCSFDAFIRLGRSGWTDAWRHFHGREATEWTWLSKGRGRRIGWGYRLDHAFASPPLVPRLRDARYVHEPRPGISHARNRGVAEAKGDFVAFIDDDELPAPNWLESLLLTQRTYRADVVLGPVRPVFDRPPRRRLDVLRRFFSQTSDAPSGTPVSLHTPLSLGPGGACRRRRSDAAPARSPIHAHTGPSWERPNGSCASAPASRAA